MENLVMSLTEDQFWRNRKVLITGNTGFKGSWLSLWLHKLGAEVYGYALPPTTQPNLFTIANLPSFCHFCFADIKDLNTLKLYFKEVDPEVVFHLAAQPLVRQSYSDPLETLSTNVIGTANVFEAALQTPSLKAIINVTSDKCYLNNETGYAFKEHDPLGGDDPYSASKACAEIITQSYRASFFNDTSIALASVRAGNVIGGGDWAKDRLIPDLIHSFMTKQPLEIRYPKAVRPWQYVLEPLSGYILLARKLMQDPQTFQSAWNFGPNEKGAKEVLWIVKKMALLWGEDANWTINQNQNPHEAKNLKLDITKAKEILGWHPIVGLNYALESIVRFHRAHQASENIKKYCLDQIEEFERISDTKIDIG
tara:strand:- start:936 stop:2036 length:1101 start_codon:yes stop_codon:yes gene_type:complete